MVGEVREEGGDEGGKEHWTVCLNSGGSSCNYKASSSKQTECSWIIQQLCMSLYKDVPIIIIIITAHGMPPSDRCKQVRFTFHIFPSLPFS